MFEYLDHTADLAFRVVAPTLDDLFADAAIALVTAIFGSIDDCQPQQVKKITLENPQLDDLLHDWLSEILRLVEVEKLVPHRFQVRVKDGRLEAEVWCDQFEPGKHQIEAEVKAVTYHGLEVRHDGQNWSTQVVCDL